MRLTHNSENDRNPTWSADGQKIAFDISPGTDREIYKMNANGSARVRLTDNSENDSNATWSPNGKKIAFQAYDGGDYEIYKMNPNGTKPRSDY